MGEGVGSRPAAGGSRAEEPIFPAGRPSRLGGKIGGAARSRGDPFPHDTIERPEQSDPAPAGRVRIRRPAGGSVRSPRLGNLLPKDLHRMMVRVITRQAGKG
jgi:hypothetical protein